MSKMLITRPNHDTSTTYLYKWSESLINVAEKNGISVSDFKATKAIRNEIEKFLKKQIPLLVVFNGHGSEDSICGYKDEVLIKSGENEHLLKSKIIYAVSCNSAKVLGKITVDKGAKCFIGYDDVFVSLYDKNCSSGRELEDNIAKPFLDSSNQVVLSLLNGKKSREAYDKSQSTFRKWIEYFSSSASPPGSEHIVSWLIWDMFCQKLIGDENACLC